MTQIIQNGPGIQYYYPDAQNNDGRITRQVVNGVEKAYTYDSLGRLATAGSASYTYDGFGTRVQQTSPAMTLTYNASNNRITTMGYSYDNNGNLTAMPNLTMSYDVENRLAQAQTPAVTENYRYAPSGQRVSKQKMGSYAWYFYGVDGRLIGTYVPCQYYGTLFQEQSTNVYFGGRTLQAQNITGIKQDRLGTTSYTTTTYAPYGDTGISPPPYGDGLGFTGYYRDGSTTGLDYAQQRYYAPSIGRFTSPDPSRRSAKLRNPLSWNRYVYGLDDPVNRNDPTGLSAIDLGLVCTGAFNVAVGCAGAVVIGGADIGTWGGAAILTTVPLVGLAGQIALGSFQLSAGFAGKPLDQTGSAWGNALLTGGVVSLVTAVVTQGDLQATQTAANVYSVASLPLSFPQGSGSALSIGNFALSLTSTTLNFFAPPGSFPSVDVRVEMPPTSITVTTDAPLVGYDPAPVSSTLDFGYSDAWGNPFIGDWWSGGVGGGGSGDLFYEEESDGGWDDW